MVVRAINRKEMDFEQGAPSNNAPAPPQMPMKQPKEEVIPEHSHPQYDAMMVKLQEIETELQGVKMGGINQESLDEGKPEDDKGKPTGGQEPIKDTQGNWELKKIESIVRKVIEELKGEPERVIGKQLDSSGPENTDNIPQTKQPSVGKAPSGGGFDSDDKTNKEDGDEVEGKTPKPGSEFDKLPIKKNKLEQAKSLIEQAKKLMKEANEPDPTAPNPGAVVKEPKKQDGSEPNKSPIGGTEELGGGASEDPEANVPNNMRPVIKEKEDEDEVVKKVFESLKGEIARESNRKTMVGLTAKSNEQTQVAQEEFLTHKQNVSKTIKEYLVKAGHSGALGLMIPRISS